MSLAGARVVVTRAAEQGAPVARLLANRGATVIVMPLIAIGAPSSWRDLDEGIARATRGEYEWVVFASVNAVEKFFGRGRDAERALGASKVAAVGPSTAAALEKHGARVDLVPNPHTARAVAESLGAGPGRVLFPRVERGPALPEAFVAGRWEVDEVAAYRNLPAPRGPEHDTAENGAFDVIVFMSPSAVDAFVSSVAWTGLGLAPGDERPRTVACIGPTTAARARERGLRADIVPEQHSAAGLLDALDTVRR
jgi:uroporphyrinogen III methyltransferase / synthase